MNTSALIFMLTAEIIIAFLTINFFLKILRKKPKSEPDSYSENDQEIR